MAATRPGLPMARMRYNTPARRPPGRFVRANLQSDVAGPPEGQDGLRMPPDRAPNAKSLAPVHVQDARSSAATQQRQPDPPPRHAARRRRAQAHHRHRARGLRQDHARRRICARADGDAAWLTSIRAITTLPYSRSIWWPPSRRSGRASGKRYAPGSPPRPRPPRRSMASPRFCWPIWKTRQRAPGALPRRFPGGRRERKASPG